MRRADRPRRASRLAVAAGGLVWPLDGGDAGVAILQIAWGLLLLAAPLLCWRVGRASGAGGGRLLLAAALAAIVALAAIRHRGDAPLHANGHAWREAREVLLPWGARRDGTAPFEHGRGAMSLQWLVAGADATITGRVQPWRISRLAGAAAAGATAMLAAALTGSAAAGLAAGAVLALMPLAQMLALSGSPLAVAAWLLPWSLALLLAAGRCGDRLLLVAGAASAALGTLSHTAMLAWAPALLAAWCLAGGGLRASRLAVAAWLALGLVWLAQGLGAAGMIAGRSDGYGLSLLREAWFGARHRDLLLDPAWVSPALLPLALLSLAALRRPERRRPILAALLALSIGSVPFFAVALCSSDAVRYQGTLLGPLAALAAAALWGLRGRRWPVLQGVLGAAALASLVALPLPGWQPPADPMTLEHRFVAAAAERIAPGTLIVLPRSRSAHVRVDFPDFVLPPDARVAFADDAVARRHAGPRLVYLGVACLSSDATDAGIDPAGLRPECRALRAGTRPWRVRALGADELPRRADGEVWTFHRLATGVPFGFFAPERPAGGGSG